MTKAESYINRGMSVKEMAVEFRAHCEDTKCTDCPYNTDSHACVIEFLMSEAPHDKTLLELFFEQNPNAPKTSVGTPKSCPYMLGYEERLDHNDKQDYDCVKCWNRLCKDVIKGYEG